MQFCHLCLFTLARPKDFIFLVVQHAFVSRLWSLLVCLPSVPIDLPAPGSISRCQAEPLYRRDLEGSEAQLGPDHPGTLISVNNFGVFLRDLGRLGESDILLQRAVAGREAQLGTSHPDTLCSVLALAKLRAAQSRLDEAELLFRRALEGLEAPLGVQHPWTLGAMAGLAKLLEAKGSFQEARHVSTMSVVACFAVICYSGSTKANLASKAVRPS